MKKVKIGEYITVPINDTPTTVQVTSLGYIICPDGSLQPLAPDEYKVKGFDVQGISQRIINSIDNNIPVQTILDDFGLHIEDLQLIIEEALYDIL